MATDLISLRLTESAIFKPGTSKTVQRQRRLPCFFFGSEGTEDLQRNFNSK